ncbi:hypothetical protein [Treponema pedis]|uniref:hypothetical protein n=1 Tax=Treponema pedis TaxID=409322 RepID=UPI0004653A9A|nr:hypothetical protein [Treponema pedis]
MQIALYKNAVEFAFRQTSWSYAVFHCVAKRRKFCNPQNLKILAVTEFIGRLILDNADSIV